MIEEVFSTVVNTTLESFDFGFCFIVNVATYIAIHTINEIRKQKELKTWYKRGVFVLISIIAAIVYYYIGTDIKVLFNSIILAPVSWSWIFKPLCSKLKIDYKDSLNNQEN